MILHVAMFMLAYGAGTVGDAPNPTRADEARIIHAVLDAPPPDVPKEGLSLDTRRFSFDLARTEDGQFPWFTGDSWSPAVLEAVRRLRPDQQFCEELIDAFDRCIVDDRRPHAIVGEIAERPEGRISVRVMFVQRFPPVREGGRSVFFQDWEYVVEVDSEGDVRVVDRTLIAIT